MSPRRSIICQSQRPRQIMDLLATDKSRSCSIIIVNYSFISQARSTVGFACGFSSNAKTLQIMKEGSIFRSMMSKGKDLWNMSFLMLTTLPIQHTVRGRFTPKHEWLISVPFQAGRSMNSKLSKGIKGFSKCLTRIFISKGFV